MTIVNNTILIFGGTGSLGYELNKRYLPDNIIYNYSRDECKHWKMKLDFNHNPNLHFIIGDVINLQKIEETLMRVKPTIIIIASAMKHIDQCEFNTDQSLNTNLLGVKNIIEYALDFIDANLQKKILVKEVAVNACTTTRNLEYLFKKNLNKTVVGYINEKKMELACHYLTMYFNISDTASMVGVNNASQFSVLFKKYKKITPKAYQQTHLIDKKGMGRRI